ncbi:MAG: hypothetical protein SPG09_12775 [Lachnospiraceae bacterium]|nr:hypothetical protein [bacterium]MDY5518463.1 hypothetical protein [Lachnospiraceae bacterium]
MSEMKWIPVIPDYKDVNEKNAKTFDEVGFVRVSDNRIFKCVICGAEASIDGSISDLGNNLICLECVHNKEFFPKGYEDAFKWCWSYAPEEPEDQRQDWRDSMLGLFLRRGGGRL